MSEQLLTLVPRPEPDPKIIAVITAAAEQMVRPAVVVRGSGTKANTWRYSGRWFAAHQVQRRSRPY